MKNYEFLVILFKSCRWTENNFSIFSKINEYGQGLKKKKSWILPEFKMCLSWDSEWSGTCRSHKFVLLISTSVSATLAMHLTSIGLFLFDSIHSLVNGNRTPTVEL